MINWKSLLNIYHIGNKKFVGSIGGKDRIDIMVQEKVAFVIPAYIRSKEYLNFFDQTLRGIVQQTNKNWQAIVIDDYSPERDIVEVLHKYQREDARIHSVFLDERRTTGECRNIGVQWAEKIGSPIVLFSDADDISHCNRVKWVTDIFNNNKEISVIYSKVEVVDENTMPVPIEKLSTAMKNILYELEKNPPHGKDCWYKIGIQSGYVNVTSATSVRTKLAIKEPFPKEYVSEDMHTWLRYGAQGEFYFDNKVHCQYRIPSYVQRQSSNSYVKDFNENKVRVDCDGFTQALNIISKKKELSDNTKKVIMLKFYMKLLEDMRREGRPDLVYQIVEKCKLLVDTFMDEVCVE